MKTTYRLVRKYLTTLVLPLGRGRAFGAGNAFTVTQLCQLTHSPPCQGGVPRRGGVVAFQVPLEHCTSQALATARIFSQASGGR